MIYDHRNQLLDKRQMTKVQKNNRQSLDTTGGAMVEATASICDFAEPLVLHCKCTL